MLFVVLVAATLVAGCAASRSMQPAMASNQPSEVSSAQNAVQSMGDVGGEVSEREKWVRARRAFSRAQKEEKSAQIDSAAFYYELSLRYLGAIDLGAIDVSMKHVLSVQRKVQLSYREFLAGLEQLPTTAGTQTVLTEVEPAPEGEAGAMDLYEEPDDIAELGLDTVVVTPAIVRPVSVLPPVPLEHNSRVKQAIKFFQGRGRKVMLDWMTRTAEVFPRIRPILREEGLPEELIFLAMVESGLKYKAYSRSRASGLWQFIVSTGRIYGLHVDRLYDERRHVERSTRAACAYLRKLYTDFGDWYLAMAAYNCGEGRVARHVRRYKTDDFWRLRYLPRQTRNYVPTYLAARIICENPEKYGFPPLPKEKPWRCRTEWVHGAYKMEDVSQVAGVSVAEIKALNPEFNWGATYSPHDSVMVRLPMGAKDGVAERLAAMPEAKLPDVVEHRVRRGETLSHIAQKYRTSVASILAMPQNARIQPRRLKPGQVVHVPMAPQKRTSKAAAPTSRAEKAVPEDRVTYTVQRGQTLGKIASILGVSVDQLCVWNNIRNRNVIVPGQKLVVRVPASDVDYAESTSDPPRYHTVRRGESVSTIAKHYGLRTSQVLYWNGLSSRDPIYPGQKLYVSPHHQTVHTVRRGETVWDIANLYGRRTSEILRWNNLSHRDHIYPGQKLRVRPE